MRPLTVTLLALGLPTAAAADDTPLAMAAKRRQAEFQSVDVRYHVRWTTRAVTTPDLPADADRDPAAGVTEADGRLVLDAPRVRLEEPRLTRATATTRFTLRPAVGLTDDGTTARLFLPAGTAGE